MIGGTRGKNSESRMQIPAKASGSETAGILMKLFTLVFPITLRK